jgi:DNA repair protein RecO (recombination protein O)
MLHRTEGIVLRTLPYGEADLIATYLSPDFGLIKLFAKSPRKIKSRFGSSLEPLTHSIISFWGKEETALPRLTQSDIIHSFHPIRDNLNCFISMSEILELTISFIPERDANKMVFPLLLDTLHDIESNAASRTFDNGEKGGAMIESLLITHYKIKFLRFAGFAPKLDSCGRCGKKGHCFYISQGSILCEACAHESTCNDDLLIKISPAVSRLYADLLTWDAAKLNRIKPSHMIISELSAVMNVHIKYVLSRPLKSMAFTRPS